MRTKVEKQLTGYNAPKLLTLTLKEDHQPLKNRVGRLLASFRKLRQTRLWKSEVRRGIAIMEVTPGASGTGSHVHLHCLIDSGFMPQKQLSDSWMKATGDSFRVHIKPIADRSTMAGYVSGYVSKSSNAATWPTSRIQELAEGLHRVRMMFSFGSRAQLNDAIPKDRDPTSEAVSCRAVAARAGRGCPLAQRVMLAATWMPNSIQLALLGRVVSGVGQTPSAPSEQEFVLALRALLEKIDAELRPPPTGNPVSWEAIEAVPEPSPDPPPRRPAAVAPPHPVLPGIFR